MRMADPGIVPTIRRKAVMVDLKAVFPEQDVHIIDTLRRLATQVD